MKPMIFQVEEAFNQLEQRGKVSSARGSRRERGEKVWIRKSRTGEKEFEAEITEIMDVHWTDEKNLIGHLHDHDIISGFRDGLEWYKKIKEIHDEIPNPIYIHFVERDSKAPYDMRKEVEA